MRRAWCAAALLCVAEACTDISSAKNDILSIQFDTLKSPSVVVGDSLRDTTGVLALPHVTAFNFQGDPVPSAVVRYHAADRGVTVDSLTGLIRGDSVRATPVRIIATVGAIQAQQLLSVTLRPDTIAVLKGRDTILYSLIDTTVNTSAAVTVQLKHGKAADSSVASYLVSFAIVSSANPQVADLVDEAGRKSRVDTTDTNGVAGLRIRLHATATGFTAGATDSIVVNATAKYRGAVVKGSPVRLVVTLKPRT